MGSYRGFRYVPGAEENSTGAKLGSQLVNVVALDTLTGKLESLYAMASKALEPGVREAPNQHRPRPTPKSTAS